MSICSYFAATVLFVSIAPHAWSQASAAAVRVEGYTVKAIPFAQTIHTVGTLRANEAVTLVSESTLRLAKICVEEGSQVKAGQLLFQLDDSELQSELAEIESRLSLALANKLRAEELLPSKAISQLEADVAAAEWRVLDAQRQTKLVQIARAKVVAPFAGRLGTRKVSEGALLSPNLPLIDLQDLSQIKIDFTLPERYAADVREGQSFSFTVAGQGKKREGKITVIEPAIDPQTRSLVLRGVCADADGLRPGSFADVTLTLTDAQPTLMVPSTAIIPSPRGHGVYVIDAGKAKFQEVIIGTRTENQVQILSGLTEGNRVATTNLNRIRPGVEVSIVSTP